MKATKEVSVFRMYKGRPAKITVEVPANLKDNESVELTKENVVSVEYLDEAFEKAVPSKETRRRIMSEISGVDVKRLPRKSKKKLKRSVGITNRKVVLVRNSVIKTETGFEMQIRKNK